MSYSAFRPTILFLTLIAVYLLLQLFRLPLTPVFLEGDHAVHLSNAWRMMQGQSPYVDFFLVTFPGTEFYYLLLFKLFGVKIYLVNVTFFGLLIGLSAVGLYFSRKILTGWTVYLPVSFFIVIGFRTLGTHASHRYFSALFVLTAFAVVFSKTSGGRLALAGFLCGIASCFTQPRGLVGIIAIAAFLLVEKFYRRRTIIELLRSFVCLAVPFGSIVVLTTIYFIVSAGYETFYFATFVFPVKNYPFDVWNNPQSYFADVPSISSTSLIAYLRSSAPSLFFYLLIPYIHLPGLIVLWLRRKTLPEEKFLQLLFVNITGLILALGVFSSPTATRLYLVSIPGLIVLFWLYQQFVKVQTITYLLVAFIFLLGTAYALQRQTTPVYHLATPSGEIAILAPGLLTKYEWFVRHTQPGEYLYEASDPSLEMLLRLKNPTPISWIRPTNFTTEKQVEDILRGLRRNPPRYIVWNGAWDISKAEQSEGFHLAPLIEYMNANYRRIENFANYEGINGEAAQTTEVWEKTDVQ